VVSRKQIRSIGIIQHYMAGRLSVALLPFSMMLM